MKILAIVLVLFSATAAFAGDTFYPANRNQFTWEPTTTFLDGEKIAEGEVRYRVYLKNELNKEVSDIEETAETSYTILLPPNGKWRVGLKALYYVGDPLEFVGTSPDIVWSDDPLYCKDGETFGFVSFKQLLNPTGMSSTKQAE